MAIDIPTHRPDLSGSFQSFYNSLDGVPEVGSPHLPAEQALSPMSLFLDGKDGNAVQPNVCEVTPIILIYNFCLMKNRGLPLPPFARKVHMRPLMCERTLKKQCALRRCRTANEGNESCYIRCASDKHGRTQHCFLK